MRVWENGQRREGVTAWDRGVQFGDGLFETIKVMNGAALALSYHERRLQTGLNTLSIAGLTAQQAIAQSLAALADGESGVLKILITRGSSARGYGFDLSLVPNITAFFSPLPEYPEHFAEQGVEVGLCKTQAAIQPQLAGLKHLNRLDNVLAASEVKQAAWQEGLMANALGHLVEGSMSNVFVCINDQWQTPKLELSGVNGTVRQRILDYHSANIVECDISMASLSEVSEMFVCNSLIGVWPVQKFDSRALNISPFTRELQRQITNNEI